LGIGPCAIVVACWLAFVGALLVACQDTGASTPVIRRRPRPRPNYSDALAALCRTPATTVPLYVAFDGDVSLKPITMRNIHPPPGTNPIVFG
jgi:hypothetical protein